MSLIPPKISRSVASALCEALDDWRTSNRRHMGQPTPETVLVHCCLQGRHEELLSILDTLASIHSLYRPEYIGRSFCRRYRKAIAKILESFVGQAAHSWTTSYCRRNVERLASHSSLVLMNAAKPQKWVNESPWHTSHYPFTWWSNIHLTTVGIATR